MESSITILFKGVCTHLLPSPDQPNVSLGNMRGQTVNHRVFFASPNYIKTIAESYRPAPHRPMLRIHASHVTDGKDGLRKIMNLEAGRDIRAFNLLGWGIEFEGLDSKRGSSKHGDDLEPRMVLRQQNQGSAERYALKPNTLLEISNQPNGAGGPFDYLLHYVATNLDLEKEGKIPTWHEMGGVQPSGAAMTGEVYCSNSTYP